MTRKKIFIGFIIVPLIILITGAFGGSLYLLNWLNTPLDINGKDRIIEIHRGAPLNEISSKLERSGLINNKWLFGIVGRFAHSRTIKAGNYLLSPSMSPGQILDLLFMGKEYLYSFTIPEGFNIYEIAEHLEKKGFVEKKKFLSLLFDKSFIRRFPFVEGLSLEGYLFPSTYFFRKGEREEVIAEKMINTFKEVVYDNVVKGAASVDLTPHEVVILASLVEKETGLAEEKEIISSVFLNRLKKNMKLQCDPTVIYALKDFDGNIRKKDLSIDSPYNTYRYRGLPSGPIANPGSGSIQAVLNPAQTDYLYFVATKKGGHYFSTNFREHQRAVNKFQLGKG